MRDRISLGMPGGDELLDLRALGVEHAQRSIAGIDQLAAEIDHVLQHSVQIQIAGQRGGCNAHGVELCGAAGGYVVIYLGHGCSSLPIRTRSDELRFAERGQEFILSCMGHKTPVHGSPL